MGFLGRATTCVLAVFILGACSPKGVEIVRFYPISPTVFADETDELHYGVAVKNYGNSASTTPLYLWSSVSYSGSQGGSCSTGTNKGWFNIGSLDPDETWSHFGPALASITQHPTECQCTKGSCSGSVTFFLFTGQHSGGILPGDASEVKMNFDQNGAITGYVVTPH